MSQQHIAARSRGLACLVVAAGVALFAASPAQAQWAAKPAPPLPHTLLDQGISGSVVLGLVFESNGEVRDARIVRSSGIDQLDDAAVRGAMRWRLDPSQLRPSDLVIGRQQLLKFYQNNKVARRVEPIKAFWREL